jgi:hypothetical protein
MIHAHFFKLGATCQTAPAFIFETAHLIAGSQKIDIVTFLNEWKIQTSLVL